MKESASKPVKIPLSHLEFIRRRLKTTNFRAEEKLKRIDDLADIIFAARGKLKITKNPDDKS